MAYLDKKSGIDPKLIKKAYGKAQQIKKQKGILNESFYLTFNLSLVKTLLDCDNRNLI